MRMFASGIHLQVAQQRLAQTCTGQQALDGLFEDELGLLTQVIGRSGVALAAGITRVTDVHLVRHLLARKLHFVSVDDDDIVTAVNVRSEARLVLTAQDLGYLRSKPTHHRVRSVDQHPFLGDRRSVGGDCFVA